MISLTAESVRADVFETLGEIVRIKPPPNVDEDLVESDGRMLVFQEQRGATIPAGGLLVDVSNPGSWEADGDSPTTLPAGSTVNSYLIHGDKVGTSGSVILQGTIEFDEPIWGIILHRTSLEGSDAHMGAAGTMYPPPGTNLRGLETSAADEVAWGGKVLGIRMELSSGFDQVRVITISPRLAFSLKIGSDREWSDPDAVNDELIDPGDMRLREGGTYWDDAWATCCTAGDPFPSAVDSAPFGFSCTSSDAPFFTVWDTDAFDGTMLDVHRWLPGPVLRSEVENASPLEAASVYRMGSLLVSFKDDGESSWLCPGQVPVESTAPSGATYGQTGGFDEIVELQFADGCAYPLTATLLPYASESGLSSYLIPDPDPSTTGQEEDDDVDALGTYLAENESHALFSVSYEAHYGGDYGTIWCGLHGPAIDEAMLGISGDTDVDAFELCWLPDDRQSGSPLTLALLYSVRTDDPVTTADESGGLTPNAIYASFMDGSSFLMIEDLPDDVDAITILGSCGREAETLGSNYCTANPNSAGVALMSAFGSDALGHNSLTLRACTLPNQAYIFFHGRHPISVPFGNGRLCTGGGVVRILPPGMARNNVATREIDLASDGIPIAQTRRFQCWFRDPAAGGSGYNTSDAISITFVD